MATQTNSLEIRGLTFRYPGTSHDSVRLREFDLAHAEQVLLTGASGTGKSTLLQLIAGLLDPAYGTVRIDGKDIHSLRGAKRDLFRGSKIGMIFQTFNLLQGFSAAENVMMALMFSDVPRGQHRSHSIELLSSMGIDTPDREITRLSVGQQQRVAVARAAASNPKLILADEPTASLDPEAADAAMDLIQSTCESIGAALLCTSHDPAMHARFQRHEALKTVAAEG